MTMIAVLLFLFQFQNQDTTMSFQIGQSTVVIHSGRPEINLADFQSFLNKISKNKPYFRYVSLAEVTGDGLIDSCITTISLSKGVPFITNTILSQGKQIWYDTLTIGTIYVSVSYWGDEKSYCELMPYSGLYLAVNYFNKFVGKPVDIASPEFSYFIGVLHPEKKDYWIDRFKYFKGHWIWKMDLSDPYAMIWDNKINKFIQMSGN